MSSLKKVVRLLSNIVAGVGIITLIIVSLAAVFVAGVYTTFFSVWTGLTLILLAVVIYWMGKLANKE